jgi:hypothetical protein
MDQQEQARTLDILLRAILASWRNNPARAIVGRKMISLSRLGVPSAEPFLCNPNSNCQSVVDLSPRNFCECQF